MAVILSAPAMMYGFDPPAYMPDLAQAQVHGCANCHGTFSGTSGISVTGVPTNYTAGSTTPVNMTVSLPGGQGFYLAILDSTGANAGTIGPGTGSELSAVGGINFLIDSASGTSWNFTWTPGTATGTVAVYVAGGTHSTSYATSYSIAGPAAAPPTLTAAPSSLTFTVNGAQPAPQTVSITSSQASPAVMVTTGVTPANSWLSATPPGGNVGPLTVTVSVDATTLTAGTTGSVSITPPSGSGITALSIPVTVNVIAPIQPALPTLEVNGSTTPPGLNFPATIGSSNAPVPQSVTVTVSGGSTTMWAFNAQPTPNGSWLTVNGSSTATATGMTPTSSVSIGVSLTNLQPGTYHGTVAFTATGISNTSGVTLPVTLTVNSQTPPSTTGESFSLVVVDRQSGGSDFLLLDGSGSVNSSGTMSGSGYFTRFRSTTTRGGGERPTTSTTTTTIVSSGTWKPTSVMSYTPISGSTTGGTLVLAVQISTHGVTTPSTGTLTITSNSNTSGVTLAINGGSTFGSVGIGTQSITHGSSSGGGGGSDTGTGTDN